MEWRLMSWWMCKLITRQQTWGNFWQAYLARFEYNTKSFSQYPFQIHEEFGLLLEDLISNSPSPTRFRPKVPWRRDASIDYIRRSMRFQSNQPNYEEHKISGKCNWTAAELNSIHNMNHVSVANGIFVQQDFLIRDEFKEVVENVYRSDIKNLDFRSSPQQSAKIINE